MMDGIQAATGATYGKLLMAKTFYGKLAATFYHPQKGGRALFPQTGFIDAMGKFEFFAYPEERDRAVPDPGAGDRGSSYAGSMNKPMMRCLPSS